MKTTLIPLGHDQLQQKCYMYLWNTYPQTRGLCFHVVNELAPYPGETKKQHMIRVSQLKSKGLLPGVWDLLLYWDKLIIFEIKVGADYLKPEQIIFRDRVLKQGGKAYVIKDHFQLFIDATKEIFKET